MLEDVIIGLSSTRFKNLQRPAIIASKSPETQVKILNKSAYYVIKDCADITLKYLPHYLYSHLKNPIASLKGKVSEQNIIDFVGRSGKSETTRQLLQIIVDDIVIDKPDISDATITDFTIPEGVDDVYGDYGYTSDEPTNESPSLVRVDINDGGAVIDLLTTALL
ncbi:hypothetical protein N9033_00130 [bacterium]|nr:hypothetical protein [bacterium]